MGYNAIWLVCVSTHLHCLGKHGRVQSHGKHKRCNFCTVWPQAWKGVLHPCTIETMSNRSMKALCMWRCPPSCTQNLVDGHCELCTVCDHECQPCICSACPSFRLDSRTSGACLLLPLVTSAYPTHLFGLVSPFPFTRFSLCRAFVN